MNIWQSVFLGIVQGITEFLPISSSGHLAILQNWMQISPSVFYFDIFLHLVSVIAIIYYFRKTIFSLNKQMMVNLIIATIPLLIVGALARNSIKSMFTSNLIAGLGLIMTAVFNFFASNNFLQSKDKQDLTQKNSFLIGLFQVVALTPGVSRSGSTLFGASTVKLEKSQAFEFSFLLAIPTILGASFNELITINSEKIDHLAEISVINYILGGLVCLLVCFASLELLKITLNKTKYHFFGWYCLLLGSITLLSLII